MNPCALIVTGDAGSWSTLRKFLSAAGIELRSASSFQDACIQLSNLAFAVVVVDCENLGATLDLFRAVKSLNIDRRPSIVALVAPESPVSTAFRTGAELVITKPLRNPNSLRVLESIILRNFRSSVRWSVSMSLKLTLEDGDTSKVSCVELWERGLRFLAHRKQSMDKVVGFQLTLPSEKGLVSGKGVLTYAPEGGYQIQFDELSALSRQSLKIWITQEFDRCYQKRIEPAVIHVAPISAKPIHEPALMVH